MDAKNFLYMMVGVLISDRRSINGASLDFIREQAKAAARTEGIPFPDSDIKEEIELEVLEEKKSLVVSLPAISEKGGKSA